MEQVLGKYQKPIQGISRIAIGFLFWVHGGQKLFAWFGREEPVELFTRFGAAGILEFFGGALIMLGLFTGPTAFILSGEMAVTYFWMHVTRGSFWPWANGGERAAMYSFIFLLYSAIGPGAFSVDSWRRKRKRGAE